MDAVCSLIAPGLGQYLQGRLRSANAQFATTLVLSLAFFWLLFQGLPVAWPVFLYACLAVCSAWDAATWSGPFP